MNKQVFIDEFSQYLYKGNGAIFVGSGVSKPSRLPDWYELIKPMASSRLNFEISKDDDLTLIAQYLVNRTNGNRGPLVSALSEQFKKEYYPNKYHQALSWMNVKTFWTTNYDTLLEQTFSRDSVVDIKANDDAISRSTRNHVIEIIKMHGCIERSNHDELVITQEDYEDFFVRRPATAQRLSMDLIHKSFLFLGYSYRDPDINNILVETRRLSNQAPRQHFMIQITANKKSDLDRQLLWIDNLRRLGIECLLVNDPDEIEAILYEIARKSRGPSIYVTGSHLNEDDPFPREIGEMLARETKVVILDGQSTGTSRYVVSSFTEEVIHSNEDTYSRLKIFPNPYAANPRLSNDPALLPVLRQWRTEPLKAAQLVLAFDGGMGTDMEVETALSLGCFVLPVPKHKNGSALRFLTQNKEIHEKLQTTCPEYLQKASSLNIEPQDVVECIKMIIQE